MAIDERDPGRRSAVTSTTAPRRHARVAEAALAIEQVVRTAQAVFGNGRLPVQFLLDGEPTDQVLGLPTRPSRCPRVRTSTVLAPVSPDDPSEGQRGRQRRVAHGAAASANSFDGTVVDPLQRWEGTVVVAETCRPIAGSATRGASPSRRPSTFDDCRPGDYVVISQTDDPSGAAGHTDTRRITVVD